MSLVGVAIGTIVAHGRPMGLVLKLCAWRETECRDGPLSEPVLAPLLIGVPVPEGNDIFIEADAEDNAREFFLSRIVLHGIKVASSQGEEQMFPKTIGEPLAETDEPLATLGVGGIFPNGLDALAEELVVRVGGKLGGTTEPSVDGPEIFGGGE